MIVGSRYGTGLMQSAVEACSEVDLEVHVAAGRIAAFALGAQGVSGRHLLPHQHVKRPLGHVSVASEELATVQLRLDVDVASEGPSSRRVVRVGAGPVIGDHHRARPERR